MGQVEREIVTRLAGGASLEGLGLGKVDGRWDLRGRVMGQVESKPVVLAGNNAVELSGYDELSDVRLEGLDLSGAVWPQLRLRRVAVTDCVWDDARIPGMAFWNTAVLDSSFRGADMRDVRMSGHAAWLRPQFSTWTGVGFSGADLRDSGHGVELYTDCSFAHARLDEVNFLGARHVRSRFEGRVEDAFFYRRSPLTRRRRGVENTMSGVDFSRANIVGCRFFDLALTDVVLPRGAEHVIERPKVSGARHVLKDMERSGILDDLVGLRVEMECLIDEGPDSPDARGIANRKYLGRNDLERDRAMTFLRSSLDELV